MFPSKNKIKDTHFKLTWFHYNKSIYLSSLLATKLNEIHKKNKKKTSKNFDEN